MSKTDKVEFSLFDYSNSDNSIDDVVEVIEASPDAVSDDDDTPARQQDIDDYLYRLESDKT